MGHGVRDISADCAPPRSRKYPVRVRARVRARVKVRARMRVLLRVRMRARFRARFRARARVGMMVVLFTSMMWAMGQVRIVHHLRAGNIW